ncbi:hypothetical protein [Rhizobium leguminosarum]|uniref:hypothetical protein n=1 Tax=Rhizobium leguminosarum TaxID=384 RepID=UPI0024B354AC|nr:hypothetical protein [Rhizobium leguminosarum]WHO77465.1 hypothetical protein QMO81_000093 [Rhizobium leguminosarum]
MDLYISTEPPVRRQTGNQERIFLRFNPLRTAYLKSVALGLGVGTMTSAQNRMQAREAILRWHGKLRPTRARCGAKRKYDGEPCQQIAMANGRCAYHGGKTGRGAAWHKPGWPNGDAPDAEQKLARKLKDQARAANKRAARLAAMTPEERERHDVWHRTHRPGAAGQRAADRMRRKQAAEMRALIDQPAPPADAAIDQIQRAIDELERQAAVANINIFD